MDFYTVCFAALMGLLSTRIVGLVSVGFHTVLRNVCRKYTVTGSAAVRMENYAIARISPTNVADASLSIAHGWYVLFLDKRWRSIILLNKTVNDRNDGIIYEIFAPFSAAAAAVLGVVEANTPRVLTTVQLNAYTTHNYDYVIQHRTAFCNAQKDAVNKLMADYDAVSRASMLLYGPPGTGKTATAEIFAMCLAEKYKVVPQVIKFNVMKPGEVIHYMPTQARPLIVLLDELPHVMEIVEAKKNTATESLSYPCMLGLLDYWGMQKHVVVIGTVMVSVSLENNELFRRGRFNNVQYFNAYYMSHRP